MTSSHAKTLGGISPERFLRLYWQRKPLLVRGALDHAERIIDLPELKRLAARDDVESRLVIREGRHWQMLHGPFTRGDYGALPQDHWTLLVQGVNLYVEAADE